MKYFGCNDKEKRIHLLRLLLVYLKYEDVQKENTSAAEVRFLNCVFKINLTCS